MSDIDITISALKKQEQKIPLTNADRIRAMTDEELAYLIAHRDCPDGHFWGDSTCGGCVKCWLDWLKQEVKK